MILEGLVTTLNHDGSVHLAPMGPETTPRLDRFTLRPFKTSQTFRNLKGHGEGVLHVTDDVLLMARAALGPVEPAPAWEAASQIRGFVLRDACRFFEFRVQAIHDDQERARIDLCVLHTGSFREFFGFNRGKHAILEAAILATRTHLLPLGEIAAEFRKLETIVQKTGGEQEREAFAVLSTHLRRVQEQRS